MQKKNAQNTDSTKATNAYKLNTEAVDRLVNADQNAPRDNTTDPGKQYRSGGLIDRIPSPIKALFIKFWFNGAVCYFILWGLGALIGGLDMLFILGVVLGMVNDLLVNNAFHFFAVTPGSNDKWMMFPKKKFWTFFANIVYSTIILLIVVWLYNFINIVINTIAGTTGEIGLGVEPIAFGLMYMGVDMLFIGMKNLFIKIISEAKEKNKVK